MVADNPKVSVVMPAYNMERYIEIAIRSVQAQTYENWELLVIDDCSKDTTCEIVERMAAQDSRIRLIRNEQNMGVSRTRNRGIDMSEGEYVAFLDSDDMWRPQKLKCQLELLKQTDAEFSYCSYGIVDAVGNQARPPYRVPNHVTYQELLRENVVGCSTVVISSPVIKKYRFGSGFYHEDYVLWVKLLQDGLQAAGCVEVLADWRYIENSRSFNKVQAAKNRWHIYREFLGLSFLKSVWLLTCYATAGLKKYMSRSK